MLIKNSAIDEVLKETGILKPKADGNQLRDILDNNRLSLNDIVEQLSLLIENSRDESIKIRGIETGLKLHKALEDPDSMKVPSITIVIQSPSSDGPLQTIPAICIPRSLTGENNVQSS